MTRRPDAVESALITRRAMLRHRQQQKMRQDRIRKFWLWCRFVIVKG